MLYKTNKGKPKMKPRYRIEQRYGCTWQPTPEGETLSLAQALLWYKKISKHAKANTEIDSVRVITFRPEVLKKLITNHNKKNTINENQKESDNI